MADELFPPPAGPDPRRVGASPPACPRCGITAGPEARAADGCWHCMPDPPPWAELYRLGPYAAPLSDGIAAMKFAGDWGRARPFGRKLAAKAVPEPDALVVPVPMPLTTRWRRGHDQAELIAASLARAHGRTLAPVLRRRRRGPRQAQLPAGARRRAMRGAIRAARVSLRGRPVWLVDDVKTTGATLAACTRALERIGAGRVTVAVVAVADPPGIRAPVASSDANE